VVAFEKWGGRKKTFFTKKEEVSFLLSEVTTRVHGRKGGGGGGKERGGLHPEGGRGKRGIVKGVPTCPGGRGLLGEKENNGGCFSV